jgi:NADH dehydrogenase
MRRSALRASGSPSAGIGSSTTERRLAGQQRADERLEPAAKAIVSDGASTTRVIAPVVAEKDGNVGPPTDGQRRAVPRILVLGAGFGGLECARRLERRLLANEAEIVVVGRDNFTLFTPMLPEVSAGGVEMRHVVTPVRAQLKRASFIFADVVGIDLHGKSVELQNNLTGDRHQVPFDHLVFALGSVTSTFDIPGVAEHSLPLKTLEDAERLRNRIIANLELAEVTTDRNERTRLLSFVVVGGGYTGCEAAGELVDLLKSVKPLYKSVQRGEARIVLIEAGSALLAGLPAAMGTYTARNLSSRGVKLILGDGVASLDERKLVLTSGKTNLTAMVLWSAGVRPTPVMKDLPIPHERNGAIVAARDLSVEGWPGLWAVGDCAWIPTAQHGKWYPMTAQHAVREGQALADNIVASVRGEATKPFDYVAVGTMASLGGRSGVAQLPYNVVLTGFVAWFLWRGYYLSKLPGLDRKIRVGVDWLLGLIFRRDIAELRLFASNAQRNVPSAGEVAPSTATK